MNFKSNAEVVYIYETFIRKQEVMKDSSDSVDGSVAYIPLQSHFQESRKVTRERIASKTRLGPYSKSNGMLSGRLNISRGRNIRRANVLAAEKDNETRLNLKTLSSISTNDQTTSSFQRTREYENESSINTAGVDQGVQIGESTSHSEDDAVLQPTGKENVLVSSSETPNIELETNGKILQTKYHDQVQDAETNLLFKLWNI